MTAPRIAGLILAGGRGSRLGAAVPKPLVKLGGRPLIAHVLDRVPPSICPVLLNANDPDAFLSFGLTVVADRLAGFQGPLAGLDAGCAWLRAHEPQATHVLCLAGDTPFLPKNLAARFLAEPGSLPRFAAFGERVHPTIGLWPLDLLDGLRNHLEHGESRSITGFAEMTGFDWTSFEPSPAALGGDPFFNVNTPDDLDAARRWLSG